MPTSIMCDRDPIFTSAFWSELFKLQTDGQNQSHQHDFGVVFAVFFWGQALTLGKMVVLGGILL